MAKNHQFPFGSRIELIGMIKWALSRPAMTMMIFSMVK